MSDNRRVKVWRDDKREWRFTYWASSDRIATSEGYKNQSHAVDMANALYPGVPIEIVEWEATGDA